ncbi:MAG: hypothetical protein ACKOYC_10075 [Bacteroidota bacterium]
MESKATQIHVISFDVPFPPTYGGVIDVYYKIKALHAKGVHVHLHCFQYGREQSSQLEQVCASVHYYARNVSRAQLFTKWPYIVKSRQSEKLVEALIKDDFPIIFEGLHTCGILDDPRLSGRFKIVRTHNVESDYYRSLAKVERNIFKRYYFHNEASKLEAFEPVLAKADAIAAISRNDTEYFDKEYKNAFYIPAFHSNEKVQIIPGKGKFALYHGNLAVGENNEAALYLVNKVFQSSDIPLMIAGSRPSKELRQAVLKNNHITLLSDLSTRQIHDLIRDAHINILPTFQPTGIKLKLLSALYNGRFAVVNTPMVENTGLEALCHVADDPEDTRRVVEQLMEVDFPTEEILLREKILGNSFSNEINVQKLLNLVTSHH